MIVDIVDKYLKDDNNPIKKPTLEKYANIKNNENIKTVFIVKLTFVQTISHLGTSTDLYSRQWIARKNSRCTVSLKTRVSGCVPRIEGTLRDSAGLEQIQPIGKLLVSKFCCVFNSKNIVQQEETMSNFEIYNRV